MIGKPRRFEIIRGERADVDDCNVEIPGSGFLRNPCPAFAFSQVEAGEPPVDAGIIGGLGLRREGAGFSLKRFRHGGRCSCSFCGDFQRGIGFFRFEEHSPVGERKEDESGNSKDRKAEPVP